MYYGVKLEELSKFYQISVEDLKQKRYCDLEQMEQDMIRMKAEQEILRNAEDQEFARIVRKFFTPYAYLRTWFSEAEILAACCRQISMRDLVEERPAGASGRIFDENAEFLRNEAVYVSQYDAYGRELAERKLERRDLYRVKHRYQGLCHGRVILDLLYTKYPQLAKCRFDAYSMDDPSNYEIYPANNIYTPFAALMSGDTEAIVKRNRDYAKFYNHGIYTLEQTDKRLASEEAQEYFDLIRNLNRS